MTGISASVARAVGLIITGSLPLLMLGALGASISADVGLANAQFGMVFASFSVASLALATTAGGVSERIGWPAAGRIGCLLSATCMLGLALFGRSLEWLIVFAVVGGAAQAVTAPAANLLMAKKAGHHRIGTAMGLKQSAVAISGILAGVAVPTLALTLGWRWALGLTGVGASLVSLTMPRIAPVPVVPRKVTAKGGQLRSLGSRFPEAPSLVLMGAAGFLGTFAAQTYNAFFVVSSVDRGMSESLAASVFAVSGVASLVVRILSGVAVDQIQRLERWPLRTAAGLLLTGAAGLVLITLDAPVAWMAGALLACGAGWGWPALYHYAIVRRFEDEPARVTGVLRVGLSGGAMLGPLIFGLLSTGYGYAQAWLLAAAVAGIGTAALAGAEHRGRQGSPTREAP